MTTVKINFIIKFFLKINNNFSDCFSTRIFHLSFFKLLIFHRFEDAACNIIFKLIPIITVGSKWYWYFTRQSRSFYLTWLYHEYSLRKTWRLKSFCSIVIIIIYGSIGLIGRCSNGSLSIYEASPLRRISYIVKETVQTNIFCLL